LVTSLSEKFKRRMKRRGNQNIVWIRLLGRLHRRTTMENQPDDQPDEARRSPPASPPYKDEPEADVGPTDPDVYQRPPRQPTPHPERSYNGASRPSMPLPQPLQQKIYDVPTPVPSTITPTSDLIREILEEIESRGEDIPPSQDRSTPPGPYILPAGAERTPSACSLVHGTYVQMSSIFPERINTSIPLTPPSSSRSIPPMREPRREYETMEAPRHHSHRHGERANPIPQGSPPLERPQPIYPIYYRDYINPDVMPAYHFICLSAWYAQMSPEIIFCKNCVTAEHSLCAPNRYGTVIRNLHVISRTFEHTQMHCGRCYKLLIKARRAIDCYSCRLTVIEHRGNIERLVYKVLCEAAIP